MTGIGGQSDGNAPFLDGYTLLPRSLDDLTDPVLSLFTVPDVLVLGGDPVFAINESENADFFQWSFGNGTFSNEEDPELTYTEPGTYNIFLTATDEESQCSDQSTAQIVVEEEDAVMETSFKLDLFPNPASDVLQVSCATAAEMVVRDAAGREVWRERMAAGRRSLDVTAWVRGVYTMEVKPESVHLATQTARFAIQH